MTSDTREHTRENTVSQIANVERGTVPEAASEPVSLVAAIERAARDPSVDVEKFERLVALQERVQAKEAERQFAEAMNAVQSATRPIAADANNPSTRSKYASYLALDKALRPIYTEHGFSLSFDTGDAPAETVKLLCHVAHKAGHTRTYQVAMPADGKGAKGGDVMTKTHAAGSAMTYGQRYLLKLIFNIAVGDDDDGNKAGGTNGGGKIDAGQLQHVRDLIEKTGSDVEKLCKYYKVEALPDITVTDYPRVIEALNTKARKPK